jgi:hypothetical protein
MGKRFFDAYSLLHFAVGVIFRHFNVGFWSSLILHTIFEWLENTQAGMNFINNSFLKNVWPGGKPYADSLLNNTGDTVFFALGWIVADKTLE